MQGRTHFSTIEAFVDKSIKGGNERHFLNK